MAEGRPAGAQRPSHHRTASEPPRRTPILSFGTMSKEESARLWATSQDLEHVLRTSGTATEARWRPVSSHVLPGAYSSNVGDSNNHGVVILGVTASALLNGTVGKAAEKLEFRPPTPRRSASVPSIASWDAAHHTFIRKPPSGEVAPGANNIELQLPSYTTDVCPITTESTTHDLHSTQAASTNRAIGTVKIAPVQLTSVDATAPALLTSAGTCKRAPEAAAPQPLSKPGDLHPSDSLHTAASSCASPASQEIAPVERKESMRTPSAEAQAVVSWATIAARGKTSSESPSSLGQSQPAPIKNEELGPSHTPRFDAIAAAAATRQVDNRSIALTSLEADEEPAKCIVGQFCSQSVPNAITLDDSIPAVSEIGAESIANRTGVPGRKGTPEGANETTGATPETAESPSDKPPRESTGSAEAAHVASSTPVGANVASSNQGSANPEESSSSNVAQASIGSPAASTATAATRDEEVVLAAQHTGHAGLKSWAFIAAKSRPAQAPATARAREASSSTASSASSQPVSASVTESSQPALASVTDELLPASRRTDDKASAATNADAPVSQSAVSTSSALVPDVAEWWDALMRASSIQGVEPPPCPVPRPLVNSGNTCFANVTIQALLACGPFRSLLAALRRRHALVVTSFPPDGVTLSLTNFYDAIAHDDDRVYSHGHAAATSPRSTSPGACSSRGSPVDIVGCTAGSTGSASGQRRRGSGAAVHPAAFLGASLRDFRDGRRGTSSMPAAGPSAAQDTYVEIGGGGRHVRGGGFASQEDAEEYLSFTLDQLHEELIAAAEAAGLVPEGQGTSSANGRRANEPVSGSGHRPSLLPHSGDGARPDDEDDSDEGGEWLSVGRGSKVSSMRTVSVASSPVRAIFGGQLCTRLQSEDAHGRAAKPSLTVEPFACLNLDVDRSSIASLEDALHSFFDHEKLEGFTVKGRSAAATRQATLQALPSVLLLHLKRFTFDMHGPHKVSRPIRFGEILRIDREHLAPGCIGARGRAQPAYQLVAVVSHHGHTLTGGHYTCDVRVASAGGGNAQWWHCDDARVSRVTPADVKTRQAYVLFYERVLEPI